MDPSYPEPLEQAFQRVEAETERRAQEELAAAQRSAADGPSSGKERRRGSISISKLGELAVAGPSELLSSGPPTPNRLSMIPSFYEDQLNHSFDSFSSAHLGQDADTEEDHGVTQLHIVGGRQSMSISKAVGNLLPRKLSRARSATIVSTEASTNVVIGVSVEEATAEAHDAEGGEHPVVVGAVVSGPSTQRPVSSDSSSLGGRIVGRARSLTEKFRRKSTNGLQDLSS